MNQQIKKQISAALEAYMTEHGLSQNDIVTKTGVNQVYVMAIRKGHTSAKIGDKTVEIAAKWYNRIAEFIGFQTEKQYWKIIKTPQFKNILSNLEDAKNEGEVSVLIGETGSGKTMTAKLFAQSNPADTFIVTVGASDNLSDLINKTMEALKLPAIYRSKSARIRQIAKYCRDLCEKGYEPMIIWDEAEYMKQPALCALKELYDALHTWCALVLIGTSQLVDNIDRLRKRNKAGIPQLYRRIKYCIRQLPDIDRRFTGFLDGIAAPLAKWLQMNCENYGELHDVLVPALREAERTGDALSVEFVKMVLRIA